MITYKPLSFKQLCKLEPCRSLDEVRHIAKLARLELADGEDARIRPNSTDIFGLIEQMQAVDTDGVEPMSHPQDLSQRLREDEVDRNRPPRRLPAVAPADRSRACTWFPRSSNKPRGHSGPDLAGDPARRNSPHAP
jgi:aspartyl-tRNA(Asn)/glutamyl-tRNA(Gln) amidotransferase subunit C